VGTVGESDAVDFTAALDTTGLGKPTLEVRGRQEPVETWVDSWRKTAEPAPV
jgi:hypothetical protein